MTTHSTSSASPNPARANVDGGGAAALVDGRTLSWAELRPLIVEASGGTVLGEWALDQRIARELKQRRLAVSEADVKREEALLREQLSDDPDQAVRLLDRLRDTRGLGPRRYDALLRRNAGLRRLVADEVKVTPAMVQALYEQRYGEKAVCRLIMVPNLSEATKVIKRLEQGASFIDLAIEVSTDSSRNQGGLLPAISPLDATFPKEIRDTTAKLQVGEVSPPIALEGGFAILKCERKIAQEPVPFDSVSNALTVQARLEVERTLMSRQARTLLQNLDVTVLDADLDRAWKQRKDRLLEP
ncbi:MAG: hypothetical protein GC159_00275 [Phycisphaera sp.]|nr:hypothetical protein [Phycisphaera sp.]